MVFYFRHDVNEALSCLADSGTSFSSADFYITPPASTLSDGDSDDEDQPESTNHLSGKQLDAPAEIVFHHNTDEVSGHQQAEDDTTPTCHNSRAAEAHPPIKEKNRTARKSRPQRKWLPVDISPKYPLVNETPKYNAKDWTPVEVFELFFDDELLELIVVQSMLYAKQSGNHSFLTDPEEMREVLGILLLSGYNRLPRRRMYWEQCPDVRNTAAADAMPRNRFDECLRNLHFADNQNLTAGDRYAKVHPIFSMLNEKWLNHFSNENYLSINESMVPYYGRHGLKQHIHGKPIRFGYKVWCLCTTEGYLIQAKPYQGAGTNDKIEDLGMGGSVVSDLISELPNTNNYGLFFDNLFTSLPLMKHLNERDYSGAGTIRGNRMEGAPLTEPALLRKKERGEYCQLTDDTTGITLVRWHDNSIVTLASNCFGVEPIQKAKRWSQNQKKSIEVSQPYLVQMYNKHMGGVDQLDHNISKLRIGMRIKKWWWPMFSWLLNVSMQNAWLVYRRIAEEQDLDIDWTFWLLLAESHCIIWHVASKNTEVDL